MTVTAGHGMRRSHRQPPCQGRLKAALAPYHRWPTSISPHRRPAWEAVGVLNAASNGLTLLGAALEHPDATGGRVSVLLSDETVVHTRRALTPTVQNLAAGTWSFGHEERIDTGAAERMAADLVLLPPA